jgi:kynurenine formamidase
LTLPTYAQLQARTDAPPASSWGLFGERGTADLAGPEQVLAAAASIRRGAVFNLDYPLDAFDPPVASQRSVPQHTIVSRHPDHRDDRLDNFWPQAASQLDSLRHFRHGEHGFYNGTPDSAIAVGSPALGINRWAEKPITGRGILLDVSAHRGKTGHPIDHPAGEHLTVSDLDATLREQRIEPRVGDILLLHTGWAHWYLHETDQATHDEVRLAKRTTGLEQSTDTLEWLWDNHFSLAASDTYALEAMPPSENSPTAGNRDAGMLHPNILGLLGLPIGELWLLHDLAADCAADDAYDCMVVVKPLHLVGGVGSPANATAIK